MLRLEDIASAFGHRKDMTQAQELVSYDNIYIQK